MSDFADAFLKETARILDALDRSEIDRMARGLAETRASGGRLFILGVGGSAGHASHAVNDFRKICGIEAYAPTDNVCELTARANDDGWETVFSEWLKISRIGARDALLVLSVGGGSAERRISVNLVQAIDAAKAAGARVFGIVGRDGGHARRKGDATILIPPLFAERVTPHTEGICAVLWHLLVSHPALQAGSAPHTRS